MHPHKCYSSLKSAEIIKKECHKVNKKLRPSHALVYIKEHRAKVQITRKLRLKLQIVEASTRYFDTYRTCGKVCNNSPSGLHVYMYEPRHVISNNMAF